MHAHNVDVTLAELQNVRCLDSLLIEHIALEVLVMWGVRSGDCRARAAARACQGLPH